MCLVIVVEYSTRLFTEWVITERFEQSQKKVSCPSFVINPFLKGLPNVKKKEKKKSVFGIRPFSPFLLHILP